MTDEERRIRATDTAELRAQALASPPLPAPEASAADALRGMAGWALGISMVGLTASFFVGWAIPLPLAGLVVAILAIRRPWESRALAWWAFALSVLGVIYSAGWLCWYAVQAELWLS